MKVGIIHESFEDAGGGEMLALYIAKALRELGNSVDIYSFFINSKNLNIVSQNVGVKITPIVLKTNDILVSEFKVNSHRKFTLIRQLIMYDLFVSKYINIVNKNYDLSIDTQSNLALGTTISYVHYPVLNDFLNLYKYTSLYDIMKKIYGTIAEIEIKHLFHKNGIKTKLLFANSRWTMNNVKKLYRIKTKILYPPINTKELEKLSYSEKIKNFVLTISRLSPEKKVDAIIDIASYLPELEFYIIGSTNSRSLRVLNVMKNKMLKYKNNNVHIITDASRDQILKLMKEASFYLHPPFSEHFGISIAEASAAGLIPIVYKDGGAWTDIVSMIDKRLGYKSLEEAVNILKKLSKMNLDYLRMKGIENSKKFDFEFFKKRLNDEIINL